MLNFLKKKRKMIQHILIITFKKIDDYEIKFRSWGSDNFKV